MIDIEKADGKQLSEMKAWFFKENVRIMQERHKLEEERQAFEREKRKSLQEIKKQQSVEDIAKRQLEKDKELFEKKVEVLQDELRRLAYDRQQLEREKAVLKELKKRQSAQQTTYTATPKLFFKGVNNESSLKKRYRDLLKIFHPDNMNGDTDALQNINKEYDNLKKVYSL